MLSLEGNFLIFLWTMVCQIILDLAGLINIFFLVAISKYKSGKGNYLTFLPKVSLVI